MEPRKPQLAAEHLLKVSSHRARELDKGEVVADYDEDLGCWGVYGAHSGFRYSKHDTEAEAEKAAVRATQKQK
jgi:hypothetical protein